ncbi:lysozyme [Burkholderia stabilis]|uniref:Lysozyme n=1 Tax=Burkholderia stabilis TaxID=95485 RepID=A0AAJ5N375_9BURK|nr:lysozyme [Burkholderia stabilis]VBB10609.1 Phage-related lysozyme (muraminidase),Phage lysozyme [Burkholderia stabilis]
MVLNSLFAAIARLFGVNPAPVVDVQTLSDSPSSMSGAAPTPSFEMGKTDIGVPEMQASSPQSAEQQASPELAGGDDQAWLELCRPLSQHFESCYLTAYPDPASPLGKALQARGLWYKVLAGAPIPNDPALRALSGAPWTCGWGSTGPDVREGTVWTQAIADARHDMNLRAAAALVDQAARVPLSAQQKAAMTSIVNNVGPGRARRAGDPGRDGIITLASGQPSTLLRHLNIGDMAGAAAQFDVWNRAGGVVLAGLVRRRAAERDLFLTGHWSAA